MEPSDSSPSKRWSSWHDRLHRQLLSQPTLLPYGARLLLAVSGGQDSMALLALLRDLKRLHNWELLVWHGDHGWHENSAVIATELKQWCEIQQQPITLSRAGVGSSTKGSPTSEATAREWRYGELQHLAFEQKWDVVTGHSASDRSETLLLNLARGCDLAGLSSLRPMRPLDQHQPDGPQLRRPLLGFSRKETLAICKELALPIWLDPSNADKAFDRNRIRLEVLPVLEELHPGCSQRIANFAERVSRTWDTQQELTELVLASLLNREGDMNRRELNQLSPASRRQLLHCWLHQQSVSRLNSALLQHIIEQTGLQAAPGSIDLAGGLKLIWNKEWIVIETK